VGLSEEYTFLGRRWLVGPNDGCRRTLNALGGTIARPDQNEYHLSDR